MLVYVSLAISPALQVSADAGRATEAELILVTINSAAPADAIPVRSPAMGIAR
jgi:hypothetical protein